MHTLTLNGAAISCTQVERGTALLRNNLGYHVGDDPGAVTQERLNCAARIGAPIVWMNQTHSTEVSSLHLSSAPSHQPQQEPPLNNVEMVVQWGKHSVHPTQVGPHQQVEADGLFLDARNYNGPTPALAVMTADCLPVIFADTTGRAIAAVHAGRVGLENAILVRTVERYKDSGILPENISVYIGPAICGRCYEVPEEMVQRSETLLPGVRSQTSWGTPSLDLAHAAQRQLLELGVAKVELSGICTYEDPHFHSYRRDSRSGRHATIVRTA